MCFLYNFILLSFFICLLFIPLLQLTGMWKTVGGSGGSGKNSVRGPAALFPGPLYLNTVGDCSWFISECEINELIYKALQAG